MKKETDNTRTASIATRNDRRVMKLRMEMGLEGYAPLYGTRRITSHNKTITKQREKKGKENSPLHPLIRKEKEKQIEKKEIASSGNTEDAAEQINDVFA